jgi:hypothetical protein
MQIILFTTSAPHPLADELIREGIEVYEALAISEVFALAEEHGGAQLVITADVEAARAKAVQQHYPTITLKP